MCFVSDCSVAAGKRGFAYLADNSSCESDLYERFSEIDEKSGTI